MMKRQPKKKAGATKGQLALIGVLGIVLVAVVASNFSSDDAPELAVARPTEAAAGVPTSAGAAPAAAGQGPFGEYAVDQNWPRVPVDDVVKFDPLADGEADAPVAPKYNAKEIDDLRSAQDAIIFMSEGETIARIGTKEFHVGDIVGGLEIREISSSGIVLGEPN
jgi:hypothetical protein